MITRRSDSIQEAIDWLLTKQNELDKIGSTDKTPLEIIQLIEDLESYMAG